MTQPRWSDPPYRDAPDPYQDWYRVPRRAEPRQEAPVSRRQAEPRDFREAEPRSLRRAAPRDLPAGRWGMMPGRLGVFIVIGSAALGGLFTIVTKQEPGAALGVILVIGTINAALVVRPRAGYLIIPVPALAYLAAACISGYIHDHATANNKTALVADALQWMANGFVAISAATVIVILITALRWRRKSRFDSFQDPY